MHLRPYQLEAVEKARTSLKTGHKRPLLMAPTAAGKTVIASEIIKGALAKGKKVVFICDRVELIDQTSATFDAFGIPHGCIQADHPRTDYSQPIQVASVQTLARRKWPHVDLIIVDEAHTQYQSLNNQLSRWDNIPTIGFSATPWSKGLGRVYDDLQIVQTTQGLIDLGYLCKFEVYGPPLDMKGVKTVRGDFDEKETEKRVNTKKIVGSVVQAYQEHGRGKPALCFAVNIAHSKALCAEFVAKGINAVHLDYHVPKNDRRAIIQRFKRGEIQVLTSVEVMTKGFDAPIAETLILARPTKSEILHVQMIGRVLRTAPGKEIATILDHAGNHERLGFVTDDFQDYLCTKEKGERAEAKKKEKLPTHCPACNFMKEPGQHECPKCGFKPEVQNTIEHEEGKLEKVEVASREVKQKWWSMLLYYGREKNYNPGWAKHKYREKFGVWPATLNPVGVPPDAEVSRWIRHKQIKYAKRRTR
jgi:superfamily II DNA or RNA helicase